MKVIISEVRDVEPTPEGEGTSPTQAGAGELDNKQPPPKVPAKKEESGGNSEGATPTLPRRHHYNTFD
jgi:hypothetical protein